MRNFGLVVTWALRAVPLVVGSAAMMVWAFLASCDGSTGTGGDASSTSTGGDATTALVDKFCADVAAAFCEADWNCCLQPGSHVGDNVNDCKRVFGYPMISFCYHWSTPDREDLEASLRAGTTIFDPAQRDTCLTLLKSMAAGGTACVEPPESVLIRSCLTAFRGQIPAGEPCTWPEAVFTDSVAQCKDGRCESGKCVAFRKLGDPCDPKMGWGKAASLICNYSQYEWCKSPLPEDGGAGDAGTMGTCAPMGDLGATCDPLNRTECRAETCDATGTCVLPDPYTTACSH